MNLPVLGVSGSRPPRWFVGHGDKMAVKRKSLDLNLLVICNGDVAAVHIKRKSLPGGVYSLTWLVFNPDGEVRGSIDMTGDDLRRAFGLVQYVEESGAALARHLAYAVDAAEQGKYFRWGPYLNIPCPGTGAQGDPNISLKITDEIRDAIAKFIR